MKVCPQCGEKLITKETRSAGLEKTWTRRRKICVCGYKVTTFELPAIDLGIKRKTDYDSGSES